MFIKNISMSLTVHPSHAYFLLGGLYLGKFTNFFSDIIITGLILYIVTPTLFNEDKIERAKNWCWSWFEKKPVTINLSQLSEDQLMKLKALEQPRPSVFDFTKLPKIEVIQSPKPVQYIYK